MACAQPFVAMNAVTAPPIPPPKKPYAPRPHNCPAHIAWGAEVDDLIPELVAALVDRCKPDKVILFGSRSRGDQRADSDVDLLVIMPHLDEDPYKRRWEKARIGASIADVRGCVLSNVLVTTQESMDEVMETGRHWCAHYDAMTQGLLLYEAHV